jgi:hypothetical protein
MSDPSALPLRPSLEQLRKRAKERLDAMPDAKLADAQFALAREYGFDSWPKLVHHVEAVASPDAAQQEQIARDMVTAYRDRDEAAATRLNDLFHSSLNVEQIRDFIRQRLFPLPGGAERLANFGLPDARLLVAGLFGFESWDALLASTSKHAGIDALTGVSSRPPFYRIDAATGVIAPQQPMSSRDWDSVIAVIKERGLAGVDANHMMDDATLARLAEIDHLAILKIGGSDRVTDEGMQHVGRMAALEELELGGWKSAITDAGLTPVRELSRLRALRMWWSRRITDEGIRHASACARLEDVNLMGTSTGDGAIDALAGKPELRRLFAGPNVTDAGLARLREFPQFASWHGGDPLYSLLEFAAGPTYLAINGSYTADGLSALQHLDGLFALNLDWNPDLMSSAALGCLGAMSRLGFISINGDRLDDEAMRQAGRLPHLRMLLGQGPVAGDEGFEGLAASKTLEHYWGRECENLTGRGFRALTAIPTLQGLAVSCKHVDDASLATLADAPGLRALMPMDVTDAGFRHVAKCRHLEQLWCMYCRETGDAATEAIARLRLRTYYAGLTKITDRSLEILARMPTLEKVHLHYCQGVTTDGPRHLAALPALREIAIEGCRNVTRDAMRVFRPGVRATYSTI